MEGMTIRDLVRRWLGLDELPTCKLLAAMEQSARDRQDFLCKKMDEILSDTIALHHRLNDTNNSIDGLRVWMSEQSLAAHDREKDRHGEVIELLTKLSQHFTTQHVGTRPTSIPVYDWEQVQLNELAEMLANPPKEEN